MIKRLWTVGHSNKDISYFIDMLKSFNIQILVDIRSLPGSNKYPWFNSDELSKSLQESGIQYVHLRQLGGLRSNKNAEKSAWKNKSFHAYAHYMNSEEFKGGIKLLSSYAESKITAIMCSEVLWWRCHRSLVADYMKSIGWEVINITDINKSELHPYTSVAKIIDGKLTYKEV